MEILIVVYDGIDVWDLAFAYKAFTSVNEVNIRIATDNENREIVCKDKNLVIGGFESLSSVEHADLIWVCQGEAKLDALRNDGVFKANLLRLAASAKKVVCVGATSTFFVNEFIDKEKSVSSHPMFSKLIKKAKRNYVSDLMLNNDNIISGSARAGLIFAVEEVFREFFTEKEYAKFLAQFNLKSLENLNDSQDIKKRMKSLKKLYKQTLKMEANKNIAQLKVDSLRNSFGFYIQENFDFFSFAIIYSMLSGSKLLNNYIIGDKKGKFNVHGGHFYVRSTHALHQIQRVGTLIFTGGPVIEHRLADNFLKYWIYKLVPKANRVISLDGSDRLLGVSGVLVDYDPEIELEDSQKYREDGKFVFLQNAYELMTYLSRNLKVLIGEKQAELLRCDYFL